MIANSVQHQFFFKFRTTHYKMYGKSKANIDELQRVKNILAWAVAQAPWFTSSVNIRRDLHRLSVSHCISYKLFLFTWKSLYTHEPTYLSEH